MNRCQTPDRSTLTKWRHPSRPTAPAGCRAGPEHAARVATAVTPRSQLRPTMLQHAPDRSGERKRAEPGHPTRASDPGANEGSGGDRALGTIRSAQGQSRPCMTPRLAQARATLEAAQMRFDSMAGLTNLRQEPRRWHPRRAGRASASCARPSSDHLRPPPPSGYSDAAVRRSSVGVWAWLPSG
jgi:hypothetical protein